MDAPFDPELDGVTDEQYRIIYSHAWQDAIGAVQSAAANGTLVERFLDGNTPRNMKFVIENTGEGLKIDHENLA